MGDMTPERIAELREKKSAYDAAITRIKAIDPTPIDPRFPEHRARVCSQDDVNAMDRWNTAIRNHADALLDAADEVAKLRAEVEHADRAAQQVEEHAEQRITALEADLARLNTPGQLVVRRGDTVTTYPFAQRVPCDDGLEFRSRTYDVQEPHREWYEERIAELEAENAKLRDELAAAHDPKSVGNIAWLAERYRQGMDLAKAERDHLRTVLVKHQWADSDIRGRPQCPSCCGVAEDEGHYSDCEIAAAICGTPKGEQQS